MPATGNEGGGSVRILAGLVVLLLVCSPVAWAQGFGGSPDQWFKVTWAPRPHGSRPSIDGYVHNATLYRVANVRLRIEGFDGERPVGERVVWTFGDIAPGDRAYFVAPVVRGATTYRITVVSFDVVSRGG
jgi:hypothetical protein